MKVVDFIGSMTNMPAFLRAGKPSFVSDEKRSEIECCVCLDCGKIELKAKSPETLR
jgi:hypothetical protein